MGDRARIYCAAFARATAAGLCGVALGLHLSALRLLPGDAALVVGAGLWGNAAMTAVVAWRAHAWGPVRTMRWLCVLLAVGGVPLLGARSLPLLVAVAFLGALNGMGRDRGASLSLEAAMLPGAVSAEQRTRAFAIHSVCQDAGHALGSLGAGFLVPQVTPVGTAPAAMPLAWLVYAALHLVGLAIYLGVKENRGPAPIRTVLLAPASRGIVARITALFLVDSLGSGFLTTAFLADWFHTRYAVSPEVVGALFAGARVANALSHLLAAWLARRIGLVNTMVFTHAPSSLLLLTVTWADSFPLAAGLFLLREGLVEMDVPTRQSFVMAAVRPEERVLVSGITNLVRMAGWALAPTLAAVFLRWLPLTACLWIGAAIKLTYDALLFLACRRVRLPEESG